MPNPEAVTVIPLPTLALAKLTVPRCTVTVSLDNTPVSTGSVATSAAVVPL
jgi:hypothetical protein